MVYVLSRNSTAIQLDFNQNVAYRLLTTADMFSVNYTAAKSALMVSFQLD